MDIRTGIWKNWERNLKALSEMITVANKDELMKAIQAADADGKRVRVSAGVAGRRALRGSYSGSSVVQNDGGMIVYIEGFDTAYVHTDGSNRITCEGQMTLAEVGKFAESNGLSFPTIPVPRIITVAGAIGTGCHGTGRLTGTLSDLVVGVEVITGKGELRKFTMEDDPDFMLALQVHLGSLGIVTEVTFQCIPAFKLLSVDSGVDMEETIKNIEQIVGEHDYTELFWFPFNKKIWLKVFDRIPDETKTKWEHGFFDLFYQWISAKFAAAAMTIEIIFPRLTPVFSRLMMVLIPKPTRKSRPTKIFHYQTYFPRRLYDLSYAFEVGDNFGQFQEAWKFMVDKVEECAKPKGSPYSIWPWHYKRGAKFPMAFMAHVRFYSTSSSYLGPANGNKSTCMFETITWVGHPFEEFFAVLEKKWLSFGGRPAWGKNFDENIDFYNLYGENLLKFNEVRKQLDPGNIFVNRFMKKVLEDHGDIQISLPDDIKLN